MRVAVLVPGLSPSFELVIASNLDFLVKEGLLEHYEVFLESSRIPKPIFKNDILILVRNDSIFSLAVHNQFKKYHKKSIYYIDDYLYWIPPDSQVASGSNRRAQQISFHLALANTVCCSTESLARALNFENKTVVIPATLNFDLLPQCLPSNKRLTSFKKDLKLVLVQSDVLLLNESEVCDLRNSLLSLNKTDNFSLHLFGDIKIFDNTALSVVKYPFMGFYELQSLLNKSEFHIALVPLTIINDKNMLRLFVECKNLIKFLNFGIASIPSIYSTSYMQKFSSNSVQFVDNSSAGWLRAIKKIIANPKTHLKSAELLAADLREQYSLSTSAKLWLELLS